jgi:hypothetical protein
MDILESKQRPQLKRSRTSPAKNCASLWQNGQRTDLDKDLDVLLHEVATATSTATLDTVTQSTLTTPPTDRKRKRPITQTPTRTSSSPAVSSVYELRTPTPLSTISDVSSTTQWVRTVEEQAEIQSMVDGAMRFSIYGHNKSPNGLKIKANSFTLGLADIAPALWRPGYLVVGAAHQDENIRLIRCRHYRSGFTSYILSVIPSAMQLEYGRHLFR